MQVKVLAEGYKIHLLPAAHQQCSEPHIATSRMQAAARVLTRRGQLQVRVLAEGYKIHFVPPDRTAIAFKTVLVGEETKEAVVLSNQGESEGIAHQPTVIDTTFWPP